MGVTLRIETSDIPDSTMIHRFRNMGEDVFRDLKDNCTVNLEEIDKSTTVFYVRDIKRNDVRRVVSIIRKILTKHNFERSTVVAIV